MKKFKDYISETKLKVKAKELDIKDYIKKGSIYKINSDGTINVIGNIDISHIELKTDLPLFKIPWNIKSVSGYFKCNNNELETLGTLEYVGGDLICDNNYIKTLGNLKRVKGNLICHDNELKSFDNLKYVGGNFNCSDNKLKSFDNLKYVGGNFNCSDNVKQFTETEIRKTIKVKGKVIVWEVDDDRWW